MLKKNFWFRNSLWNLEIHSGFLGYDISKGQIHPIDRAIQFVNEFSDVIIDKMQLQRFLGSLNYIVEFYKDLRKQCKPLFDRLQIASSLLI